MKEVNQQAQQQAAAIQQIGNYAMYHNQLGHNAAEFMVGDVIQLARAAMQTSELEEALRIAAEREDKIRNDWKAEVDGLVSENNEANIRVDEMKIDVTNAEAYSQELAGQLDAARKEVLSAEGNNRDLSDQLTSAINKIQQLTNLKDAAVFWYDAFKDVHMALGGNDAVNVAGADDKEFVNIIVESVKAMVIRDGLKRNDSHKVFNAELLKALGIDEGFTRDEVIEMAKGMMAKSDEADHKENYQKKYNELKSALGLSGYPHYEAVKRAAEYTPGY